MRFAKLSGSLVLTLVAAIALASAGCGQGGKEAKGKETQVAKDGKAKHGAWWCQEHGVPEHLCSLCNDEMAEKYKKEGKWCKLHDRAEEQCFKCDPSRYKKYEDIYVAKYGKKPTPPPKEEFEK